MNRDFKGVWIPKEIWEKNLPINDKFYLGIYSDTKDIKETDSIMLNVVSRSSLIKIKTDSHLQVILNLLNHQNKQKK